MLRKGQNVAAPPTPSKGAVHMYGMKEIKEVLESRDKGWSQRKTADELNYSRNFVRRFWKQNLSDVVVKRRKYQSRLDPYADEIRELYDLSEDNCDVVRYELMKKHPGLIVSLRTVERYTEALRRQKKAEEHAYSECRRFETRPGEFMQIDYGTKTMEFLDKHKEKVNIFVAVLAYSRRIFVKVTEGETQEEWLSCIDEACLYFGGLPLTLVCDNAKPLVTKAASREDGERTCVLSAGLLAYCSYWGIQAIACYPYHPQSKGKVESAVKYVKRNGLAGRKFANREEMQAHLTEWAKNWADWKPKRLAGGGKSTPAERFEEEMQYLRPIEKPRFLECREEVRKVRQDGIIQVENAFYQLPIRYAKTEVRLIIRPHAVEVYSGDRFVQTFRKGADQKTFELLDSESTFGAADPSLPAPVALHRSLAAYGKAAAEAGQAPAAPSMDGERASVPAMGARSGAAPAGAEAAPCASGQASGPSSAGSSLQARQSPSDGAETASAPSGAPSASEAVQKRPGLSAGTEEPSGDCPGGQSPFTRDLLEYQKFSGGFKTCSMI